MLRRRAARSRRFPDGPRCSRHFRAPTPRLDVLPYRSALLFLFRDNSRVRHRATHVPLGLDAQNLDNSLRVLPTRSCEAKTTSCEVSHYSSMLWHLEHKGRDRRDAKHARAVSKLHAKPTAY
jgi:hypothetical protein